MATEERPNVRLRAEALMPGSGLEQFDRPVELWNFGENVPTGHRSKGRSRGKSSQMAVQQGRQGLTVDGVAKAYGATVALANGSLHLASGQVHGLLGENGAGKSTLVKILSGVVRPDTGRMLLDGVPYSPSTILDARAAGVATAFQELSLPPNLSVAEGLLMPTLKKGVSGLISSRKTTAAAQDILERYNLSSIDASAFISELALADRQRLEIVRALHHATKVLVLDEPTASLAEVDWLFDQIRQATGRGIAILYISHRLAEIRSLCPVATVLRNGQSVATVDLAEASDERIFELMVGHSKQSETRRRSGGPAGKPMMTVKSLQTSKLRDVSFEVRAGEILGVAALDGQGQKSLFYSLVGLEPRLGGEVFVEGKLSRPSKPQAALADGLSLLPEERKTEGILTSLSAASNIVLPIVQRISRGGFIWPGLERSAAIDTAQAVELSPRYMDFRMGDLSGRQSAEGAAGPHHGMRRQDLAAVRPHTGRRRRHQGGHLCGYPRLCRPGRRRSHVFFGIA